MVTGREERNTGGDRRTREKTDRRRSEDPGVRDQQKEGQKRERQVQTQPTSTLASSLPSQC